MPHVNVAVRETANYTYLLSLNSESWYGALELCQQYGDGFYLANIDDANELDSLRPWLTDAADTGIMDLLMNCLVFRIVPRCEVIISLKSRGQQSVAN